MIRIAVVALVAAVAGLGTSQLHDSPSDGAPAGVGQVRAGSVASLAQCSDWNEGTEAEKRATITDIHAQLNQAGADGPTPDLAPDDAYDLFERACSNDFAAGFRLYKIYARAAAFAPLTD